MQENRTQKQKPVWAVARSAAFAPAKAAQRSLAKSMTRQLGPVGIHVALRHGRISEPIPFCGVSNLCYRYAYELD